MKIIIIGYGRVGTQVLQMLSAKDHSIVIVDKNRGVLDRTVQETGVRVLIGDAVDPDMLRQAGVEKADVLLALTRDENTNLMVAQMARIVFKVPKVMAVVSSPCASRAISIVVPLPWQLRFSSWQLRSSLDSLSGNPVNGSSSGGVYQFPTWPSPLDPERRTSAGRSRSAATR